MARDDFKIVPATPEIMRQFYGQARTCRAYAAIRGDEVLGIAGIRIENHVAILFSDMKDSERHNKRLIVKGVRIMQAMIRECFYPVYAEAEKTIRGSDTTLKHMGFENLKENIWHSSP